MLERIFFGAGLITFFCLTLPHTTSSQQYCKCKNGTTASSYADVGSCVVRDDTRPRFCTLDWRSANVRNPSSDRLQQRELNSEQFLESFLELGGWQDFKLLADDLRALGKSRNDFVPLTTGASAYLEETQPGDADPYLLLASILVLLGSIEPQLNQDVVELLAAYVDGKDLTKELALQLTGEYVEPSKPEIEDARVVSVVSYGCLEISFFYDEDKVSIAVRTPFAEDEQCGV